MKVWKKAAKLEDLPVGSKGCVKFGNLQIALVHYQKDEWYAVQNRCPHKNMNVLSRGLMGDQKGEPKLVCPLHKNAFSLKTGEHLGGDPEWTLLSFPVKVEGGDVWLEVEEALLIVEKEESYCKAG